MFLINEPVLIVLLDLFSFERGVGGVPAKFKFVPITSLFFFFIFAWIESNWEEAKLVSRLITLLSRDLPPGIHVVHEEGRGSQGEIKSRQIECFAKSERVRNI